MTENENVIKLAEKDDPIGILDSISEGMSFLEEIYDVAIVNRDNALIVTGNDSNKALMPLREFIDHVDKGNRLDRQSLGYIVSLSEKGISYTKTDLNKEIICFSTKGVPIKPKTNGQLEYINNMKENDICFGIGPAGTGKTYLAVASAVKAYKNKEVDKIILARPAVEAGERLGFLPGDLNEKVDPYLRPLYDALYDLLGRENTLRLKEKEIIEIVPLAYMRGRTLDNSYIILDEAQNTTREQMVMFLTRLGFGSKAVITGDITQIDLPKGKKSGLVEAVKVLKGVKGIGFDFLKDRDVVRHELVKRIIKAYDSYRKDNPEKEDD